MNNSLATQLAGFAPTQPDPGPKQGNARCMCHNKPVSKCPEFLATQPWWCSHCSRSNQAARSRCFSCGTRRAK